MYWILDLEHDLSAYCLKHKGKWWATRWWCNKEAKQLYCYLRKQNVGVVRSIVTCGCADYKKHIDYHKEVDNER